ncbi:hypothetical protein F4802DRAFT_232657 [Xylaria palmicola]|nr:hypothetical protein F4802DRAFT_232657 [Xylaria palmicola]
MPIQFIDNTSIDKKTRTLIRSHVAKGKNLGRTIHRPSRHPRRRRVAAAVIPPAEPPPDQQAESRESDYLELSLPIQRQLQGELSTTFPFDVSWACRGLFYRFVNFVDFKPYPPELRETIINVNGPRLFLGYSLVDEAFFHCVVALSVAVSVSRPVTRQERTEAFRHLSRSLRLVNERLVDDGGMALSDATVAVVVAMTQYERFLGCHGHALVHFEGLQRIVALRGGIAALFADCPRVAQKALRADLDFAIQLGSPTRFGAECVPGESTLTWLGAEYRRARGTSPDTPAFLSSADSDLQRAFEDISTLSWFINDNAAHGLKLDDYDFHNILLSVGYHLLEVRPLSAPIRNTSQPAVLLHLGLTALMTMFFFNLGVKPLDVLFLARRIASSALERRHDDREEQELLLWLLFTARVTVFRDGGEDAWLTPTVAQLAVQLGLLTWDHVSQILTKFPWVGIFSNDTAQTLWNQVGSISCPLL